MYTSDDILILSLPYPVGVNANTNWMMGRKKVWLNPLVRIFRWDVKKLSGSHPGFGHVPVSVEIAVHPPDRRPRDIDNLIKIILDALQHAGVYDNDNQVSRLLVERRDVMTGGGKITIGISAMNGLR